MRIQRFDGSGAYLGQWGSPGSGDGEFNSPTGVATDARRATCTSADALNHRIQKFTAAGAYLTQWGSLRKPGPGSSTSPYAVAVDRLG